MRGVELDKDIYTEIFGSKVWKDQGVSLKLEEAVEEKAAGAVADEVVEAEVHSCPLCESTLDEPLSQEKIDEHVSYLLGVINEAFELEDGVETIDEDEELVEDADGK